MFCAFAKGNTTLHITLLSHLHIIVLPKFQQVSPSKLLVFVYRFTDLIVEVLAVATTTNGLTVCFKCVRNIHGVAFYWSRVYSFFKVNKGNIFNKYNRSSHILKVI